MTNVIDGTRLKALRIRRGMKRQEDLAKESRLNKQTIYRLENGRVPNIRPKTIEKLCTALDVEPNVLSGEKPIPDGSQTGEELRKSEKYQVPGRIDGRTRNALSLVALRYGIPVSQIIELAPLLFVLSAEQSLDRRRAKLSELKALLAREAEMRDAFPHLPMTITPGWTADDAIDEEEKSIAARDLFGAHVSDEIFRRDFDEEPFDADSNNPFVLYLGGSASQYSNVAEIISIDARRSPQYRVCREDALKLAGGDEATANGILNGWVQIHEIPRELLAEDESAQRVEWLRPKVEAFQAEIDRLSAMSVDEIFHELGLNKD